MVFTPLLCRAAAGMQDSSPFSPPRKRFERMQNMCCRSGERHDLKRVNWSKRFDSIAFTSCTMTDYKNMKCISEGGVMKRSLLSLRQK
jgi:hypothetical protein